MLVAQEPEDSFVLEAAIKKVTVPETNATASPALKATPDITTVVPGMTLVDIPVPEAVTTAIPAQASAPEIQIVSPKAMIDTPKAMAVILETTSEATHGPELMTVV